jgi:hypothetical protein
MLAEPEVVSPLDRGLTLPGIENGLDHNHNEEDNGQSQICSSRVRITKGSPTVYSKHHRGHWEQLAYHATKQIIDATNNKDPKPDRGIWSRLDYLKIISGRTTEEIEEYFLEKIVWWGTDDIFAILTQTTCSHVGIQASFWRDVKA